MPGADPFSKVDKYFLPYERLDPFSVITTWDLNLTFWDDGGTTWDAEAIYNEIWSKQA